MSKREVIRVCQECYEFIFKPISEQKFKDRDIKTTGFKEVCNKCYKNGKTLY